MPATPLTWLQEFVVNTTTANLQIDPEITQLANGNILVSWTTTDAGGLGSPQGTETLAQIFDPLGNRIGGEIRLNNASIADNEQNADLAALPGGGFIAVYHGVDFAGGGGSNIRLEEFDANGDRVTDNPNVVLDSASGSEPNYRNPVVAVSSATSVIVVYEEFTAAGTKTVGKIYNPATDTYGAQFDILTGSGAVVGDPDVTVLTNGNYVITQTFNSGGNNAIAYNIFSSTGSAVSIEEFVSGTDAGTASDREATVTALTGGGFVIAWTNVDADDTDILFKVYNAAGTETGSGSSFDTGSRNNNNDARVIALADGSFIIACDNDASTRVDVQHFSAAGIALGSVFTVTTDDADNISGIGLADGRVALVWDAIGGEIKMEILDTRDAPNNPAVYTPDGWQIGTAGGDVFTADGAAEIVHGHTGNDIITENGSIKKYFGGGGNDIINVVSVIDSDLHHGGSGTDTIDWSASGVSDSIFNLAAGTATSGIFTEQMLNFENLNGTSNGDTIIGSAAANILNGKGGNDTINGGLGNDILNGGGGKDTLRGGGGNDTYIVNKAGEAKEGAGLGIETVKSSVDYTLGANIEKLVLRGGNNLDGTGNDLNNNLKGNAGNNRLSGLDGNDRIGGLGGNDTLSGGGGDDVLTGGAGRDRMDGGLGADRFDFNALTDSGVTAASRDIVAGFDAGSNVTTVDRIDLSTIDAIDGGANQAFTFGGAFTAGHVQVVQSGTSVLIHLNTDADAGAEMVIEVQNANAGDFNASDFIL